MTDPTEMVLTGTLVFSLAVVLVSLNLRSGGGGQSRASLSEVPAEPENPFEPPSSSSHLETVLPPENQVGKVAVWFYRPIDLLGAGFVFVVFCGLAVGSFGMTGEAPKMTPSLLMVNIGFQFLIAGIVVVFATLRTGIVTWLGLRWRQWPWVLLIAPGAVVVMWAMFGVLQVSGYLKWMESLGVETVQDTVKLLQESNDPVILGLMAVAAVVAAPICEEIVFRGYFYPVLKKFCGIWPAALCSALVFASAHGSLTALLPLFIFGGVLVFVYEKTGSIWAPIAVHMCFNGGTVLAQFAARILNVEVPV